MPRLVLHASELAAFIGRNRFKSQAAAAVEVWRRVDAASLAAAVARSGVSKRTFRDDGEAVRDLGLSEAVSGATRARTEQEATAIANALMNEPLIRCEESTIYELASCVQSASESPRATAAGLIRAVERLHGGPLGAAARGALETAAAALVSRADAARATEIPNPETSDVESENEVRSGKAEDGKAEDGKAEDGKAEGGKPNGGKTNGGKADGGKADGGKTEGGKTEGSKTEGSKAEGSKADIRAVRPATPPCELLQDVRALVRAAKVRDCAKTASAVHGAVNKSRGVARETDAIDAYQARHGVEVFDRNAQFFTKRLGDAEYRCWVGGRVDGLQGDRVIEVKCRRNRFFSYLPEYEKVQVHAYMFVTGRGVSDMVQYYDGEIQTSTHMFDAVYWDGVCKSALRRCAWLRKVLACTKEQDCLLRELGQQV